MNTHIRTTAAAMLALAAAAGLTACGDQVDLAPAASVQEQVKPLEHQGQRDLSDTQRQQDRLVKPFEHRGRRPS